MIKEIKSKEVMRALQIQESQLSKQPNSNFLLTYERRQYNDSTSDPDLFNVQVRCRHPNYLSILNDIYEIDKNIIWDGGMGVSVFDLVDRLRVIIRQLEKDGYVYVDAQNCSFHTEYGGTEECDKDGNCYIRRTDPKLYFSKEELEALNSAIFITTKGRGMVGFLREKIYSEPLALLSLAVSVISLLVSFIKFR